MSSDSPGREFSSIRGIGTDIIEIDRFKEALEKYGQKFLDRLFTSKEQEYCHKYKESLPRFAARFAAKEAIVKALGDGFGKHVEFLDIEILPNAQGKPIVHLSPRTSKHYNHPLILLSISHCKSYATASAVLIA